jgi:hypothetical protein
LPLAEELNPHEKFRKPRISVLLFHTLGKGKAGAKRGVDEHLMQRLYSAELKLDGVHRIAVPDAPKVSTVSIARREPWLVSTRNYFMGVRKMHYFFIGVMRRA